MESICVCEWTQYEQKGESDRLNMVLLLCFTLKSTYNDRNTLPLVSVFYYWFYLKISQSTLCLYYKHHKLLQSNMMHYYYYYLIASTLLYMHQQLIILTNEPYKHGVYTWFKRHIMF